MKKFVVVSLFLMFALGAFADEIGIGAKAPAFSLVNAVDGKSYSFTPGSGKPAVVIFTCDQCPWAKAFEPRLIAIARQYQARGVTFYAIDSNDDSRYSEETLANMKDRAESKGYPYPYLKDGDSAVARSFGARVTPHIFVIDGRGAVRYRGYVDDAAKAEERKTTGLTDALDAILAGREVANATTRAFGCSIKFKG